MRLFSASPVQSNAARKTQSVELRHYCGYFVLLPVCFGVGGQLAHAVRNPFLGVVFGMLAATFFYFGAMLWARHIPATLSLALGFVVWAACLWKAWHGLS